MKTRSPLAPGLALAFAFALAAATLTAVPARAWDDPGALTWADGRAVDVQVLVAGRAAPQYLSPRGDERRYFQAFAGRNYSLVLRNHTGERVGVLIAVDGINVVNGERSRLRHDEPMYVLGPYETTTIDGWRTSLDDIRRFVFVDEHRSYAARTDQANGDMGWIRVLAFREQTACWPPRPIGHLLDSRQDERAGGAPSAAPQSSALPAPGSPGAEDELAPSAPEPTAARGSAKSTARREQAERMQGDAVPGTGWGGHQSDHVERVQFTAETRAADTIVLRYEYASGLRSLGIFPVRDRVRERDDGELGFAKPPRW